MKENLLDIIKKIGDREFNLEYFEEFYRWILQLHLLHVEKIHEKKAQLVTIDGMGGSGKDSCIEALCSSQPRIEGFREDDFDPFHRYVRRFWAMLDKKGYNPLVSAYLIAAGKRYLNEAILGEKLQDPAKIIVTNRSFLTTIMHSSPAFIDELLRVYSTFPYMPDVRIVFICNPDIARQRVLKRGFIGRSDSLEYLKRTYSLSGNIKNYFPEVKLIDTSNLSIAETAAKVQELIQNSCYSSKRAKDLKISPYY